MNQISTVFQVVSGSAIQGVQTLTWHPLFRQHLVRAAAELDAVSTQLRNFDPCSEYGLGFVAASESFQLSMETARLLGWLVESLDDLELASTGLYLFKHLITGDFSDRQLHALFTLCARRMRGDKSSSTALHSPAPISSVYSDNRFPVHADLYGARALWNVFTSTSGSQSGGAVQLVSISEFESALSRSGMSRPLADAVVSVLRGSVPGELDCFDLLYDTCYHAPWNAAMENALRNAGHTFFPARGEGYLLLDGPWLHGRGATRADALSHRFERLTFDCKASRALKPVDANAIAVLRQFLDGSVVENTGAMKATKATKAAKASKARKAAAAI
jgi:hypothetical protein